MQCVDGQVTAAAFLFAVTMGYFLCGRCGAGGGTEETALKHDSQYGGRLPGPPPVMGSARSRGDYREGGLLRRGDNPAQALKGEQDFPTNDTSRANQEVTARAKREERRAQNGEGTDETGST